MQRDGAAVAKPLGCGARGGGARGAKLADAKPARNFFVSSRVNETTKYVAQGRWNELDDKALAANCTIGPISMAFKQW